MALTQNTGLLTSTKITKEALYQLTNNCLIASKCDWKYSEQFAQAASQIGDSIFIRRPILPTVTRGSMTWTGKLPVENTVALTIDENFLVPLKFNDTDRTLRIENFSKRFIAQAVIGMASQMDSYVYGKVMNSVSNTVGQYNNTITSDTILEANEILTSLGCPDDGEKWGILTPKQNRSLVNVQATLFNAQKEISDMYRKGRIGEYAGIEFAVSNSGPVHTDGTWAGTPTVSGASSSSVLTSGWAESATLSVNGFTAGATLNAGDVFSISGTYAYNPLTRAQLPFLQQFVVLTAVAAATSAAQSVVVSPALVADGEYKNVEITISGTTPLIKYSTSGTTGREGIIFHREAIAIASPTLFVPKTGFESESMKDDETGINIRYVNGWDPTGSYSITRLDAILGAKVLRPEHVCRVR